MSTAGLFQALDGLDIDTLPYVMVTTECFCGPTLAARADMDAGKKSLLFVLEKLCSRNNYVLLSLQTALQQQPIVSCC